MASNSPHQGEKEPIPQFFFEITPPSPLANLQAPFFRFPREIRDKIYHYLWVNQKYDHWEPNGWFRFEYNWDREIAITDDPLPTWLLASKQLLAEAMIQFYRCATCSDFQTITAGGHWKGPSSPYRLLNLNRITKIINGFRHNPCILEAITDRFDSPMFYTEREHIVLSDDGLLYEANQRREKGEYYRGLDTVQGLEETVLCNRWRTRGLVVPDYMSDCHSYNGREPQLRCLIDHFRHRIHSVKDLTLSFQQPLEPQLILRRDRNFYQRNWSVDMFFLERLPCTFDRVEFRLEPWMYTMERGSWTHMIFVEIQQEFARVAKVLVGGNEGGFWALRDWVEPFTYCDGEKGCDTWRLEVRRLEKGPSRGEIMYQGPLQDNE